MVAEDDRPLLQVGETARGSAEDKTIRIRPRDFRAILEKSELAGDGSIYFRDLSGAPRAFPSFAHIHIEELDNRHITACGKSR